MEGYKKVVGTLKTYGIKVQKKRSEDAYHAVATQIGFPSRRRIPRCVYFVRAPLALWHVDGYHALIR
jgi:hypothetical protein